MVAVGHVGLDERLVFVQAFPTFFVIQTVAHGLAVRPDHRQVHFGNDVRQDSFDCDRVRDYGLYRLGTRLIETRVPCFSLVASDMS